MTTYYDKPKRDFDAYDAPLASLESRLVALMIDSFILAAVAGAGLIGTRHGAGGAFGLIVGVAYQWFFLTQNNGQTIGKMLMGIRVVKANGQPLQATDAILRYAGSYLNSFILMLGWLWASWDDNRQGWHDKLAGTIVVRAK
jgi:uncharacterized RDD family membrane protein YckC